MLKSLELFGFKSFADRTRFDFASGITCVVGPNGSGKSNVVDALKWILGDQSAKSLRGKEMTDVIFNGSSGRKPSSFAEATLTFDNSSGLLPIDSQEVHVGRRIWRSGDSEYLINRTASRLKDVRDLFLGTGAGAAAYSIIEQGRVDQILQANPTSRRVVFEEAAGISRYKSRKLDAQRKLERVAQNLLRLTDIVDQVEAQLNSLRTQAAKAAKFREVSQDLREWWLGLAADDYRNLTGELRAREQALADLGARIHEFQQRQREREEQQAAIDEETAELDRRLREVDRCGAANREAIAEHQTTLAYNTARLVEIDADLAQLRKQHWLLGRRMVEVQNALAQSRARLEQCDHDAAAGRAALERRDLQIDEQTADIRRLQEQVRQHRELQEVRLRQLGEAEKQIVAAEAELQSFLAAERQIEHQLTTLAAQIEQRCRDRDRQQQRHGEAADAYRAVQQELHSVQARRRSLSAVQDECTQELAREREERSALEARQSLLADLESRQEGLGLGVKEILSRARSSHYPPWNSIVGSVADLFEVDLEHAALLDVALGARAQLIVLSDLQALIEYLNGGTSVISGRVGFVVAPGTDAAQPLSARAGPFQIALDSLPDLSACEGVVTRADRLVACPRIGELPAQLLGDTWIVETIEAALHLWAGEGRGCRFVTRQGEVLDRDGTLHVGTIRSETAIVSRKSELRHLRTGILRLQRVIDERERELSQVHAALSAAGAEHDAAAERVDRQAVELARVKADLQAAGRELDRLHEEGAALEQQAEQSAGEIAVRKTLLDEARGRRAALGADHQQAQQSLTDDEQKLAEQRAQLEELERRRAAERLELAKQQERLEAQRETDARLQDDARQRQLQRDEAERRLWGSLEQRSQVTRLVLNARASLAELHVAREATAQRTAAILAEKRELRRRRAALSAEVGELRSRRRELSEARHQEEIRLQEQRHQIATLAGRLQEEFQLKLEEVAATGMSAFKLYLKERRAAEAAETPAAPDDPGDEQIRFADVRDELESRVHRLRKKLKLMGNVNTDSLNDLEELEQRFGRLSAQLQDLVEAKAALEDIIRRINSESKRLFSTTFETIRGNFQDLFRKVFGGGEGDIVLEDPEDILECGIDIVARPPGKELRSISLLSGGEKTMTAIALIMAIFKSRPSPFCILDEVDAALDEANVDRYTSVLAEFQESTQFIMITHHKRSMLAADVIYGVTMEESGISKRMSVRFEDVTEDGQIRRRHEAA